MAEFIVTDPASGQKLKLTGDSPPTEAELEQIFGAEEPAETSQFPGALGSVSKFGEGLFRGLQQAKAGAQQLFSEIPSLTPATDPAAEQQQRQELKSEIAMRDIRIRELGLPGQAGAIVGETLPSLTVPGGPTGALTRRLAGGVAADVVASVADPVREDETRLGNIGRAAAFSGGIRGTGAGLSSGFRKISNVRTGQFADADVKKLIDSADSEQISIFFDDVTQGTFAQKASVAAEMFGRAGTGAGRIRQNKEALAAATRWLNKVSNDSDDFAEIVQTGLVRKLDIFKREASRKYARVGREIGDAGNVETKIFDRSVDSGVAAETTKGTRSNAAVVDFLNRFKDAPRGDFNAMIEFRSDFTKELGDFLSGDVSISKSSIDVLTRAKNALDADMTAFAKANGANDSWKAANNFYKNTVIQFKKGKLKALVNERSAANFDEQAAWRYLVQNSTNPRRARLMFQSLDAKGREAVRFGLVKEAMSKASPEGAPFSPARFAGYLESREAVVNQFFKGKSNEEIKGLIKVMRHIERAGQFAENPPTGQRLIPVLFAGGAFFEPGTVAAATGVSLTIKGLFQTKSGRNLLLAASTATPGSKQFDTIMQNLETVASRASN